MAPEPRVAALRSAADAALLSAGVADPAERTSIAASLGSDSDLCGELAAGDAPSQRALLAALKAAGVAKLGTRHKAASALLTRLDLPAVGAATPAPATGLGDDFWAQISLLSCAATEADGLPVGPPAASLGGERQRLRPDPPRAEVSVLAPAAAAVAPPPTPPPPPHAATAAAAATAPAAAPRPAVPVVPLDQRPIRERVSVFRQCGREAYGRGDAAGAELFYGRALALSPDDADLHTNLAACALAGPRARPSLALQRLGVALALTPGHFRARMRAARCYTMLGR